MDGAFDELARHVAPTGLLGYLNFSDGRPDPRWQRSLADAYDFLAESGDAEPWRTLERWLLSQAEVLERGGSSAFRDLAQARAVVALTFSKLLPAYRLHHADLLAHQPDADLFAPFFLARAAEAVLAQGPPWDEESRVVVGAMTKLDDFVGHRPIAVLETRPQTEFYPHEKVRPVPLYLHGAGVAPGRYQPLIERALAILRETDPDLLAEAAFDPELLEELALDPRAFDHHHPVNRRPNYLFGEWDPHHIDGQGRFRRFVLRQATLDALLERVESPRNHESGLRKRRAESERKPDGAELVEEAAAVLAGTILMAAGSSGAGPTAYDSTISLSKLVPRIARYRDAFYTQLRERIPGTHGERLREEAKQLKQPFGGARQALNQSLARQRAVQLQERHLALAFAEMGFPRASRERAANIPTASLRFRSEIRLRQTAAELAVERGAHRETAAQLAEVEDLLRRGIDCGALPDPWNILGFQGLYPLFTSREDSVRDSRNEDLVAAVGRQFDLYARLLAAVAADGDKDLRQATARDMERLAAWWDKFATSEVSDLPRIHGGERAEAARHVADSLAKWRNRPEGTNDLAFWRQHREGFRSPAAFAQVVEALLRQRDWRAALALLMTWLSQADAIALEETPASFQRLTLRWLRQVVAPQAGPAAERSVLARRFFELLEANADTFWRVPALALEGLPAEAGDDDPDERFGAAYEEMTYRDSTDDGEEGSVAGDGPGPSQDEFQLEAESERLTQRLQFLATVARLWQTAARADLWGSPDEDTHAALSGWLRTAREHRRRLPQLIDALFALKIPDPVGEFDAVVEYDRRRTLRDQLIETAIATAVEVGTAARRLASLLLPAGELPASAARRTPAARSGKEKDAGEPDAELPWETAAVRLERAIDLGDVAAVRRRLNGIAAALATEPILFVPLGDGGEPRQIFRARANQAFLQSLLERLPYLGLLRETFQLTKLAKSMERNAPAGGRKVSEFDRLFRTAERGVVEALLRAAAAWDRSAGDVSTGRMAEVLHHVSTAFLNLWLAHSQTLRLSVLEAVSEPREFESLRKFVKRYGGDLFTPTFLTPANLRGILHQGVRAYLDLRLAQADPAKPVKLLDDLEAESLTRDHATAALETVLHAVLENYEEYRDYNTTTTQSDYGENLHLLLDFLRVKATYDRFAWRLRPLALAHEVLCRRGHESFADRWRDKIAESTKEPAAKLLEDLGRLESGSGLRLRTVRDRIEERFLQPLLLDRLCARVEPAMTAARAGEGEETEAFTRLVELLAPLTASPTGVGLDVPHWLQRLEREVQRVRTEFETPGNESGDGPRRALTFEDLQKQIEEWDRPLSGE